jgi:hypothetical protein
MKDKLALAAKERQTRMQHMPELYNEQRQMN